MFEKGNTHAKGQPGPHASKVQARRKVFYSIVNDEEFELVVKAILAAAKKGNFPAQKLIVERTLGKIIEAPIKTEETKDSEPIKMPDIGLKMA